MIVGETLKARLARKGAEIEDIAKQKKPPALPRQNEIEVIVRLERERQVFRDSIKNCRAALRMIREAVETHAPPGSLPVEEYVEPPFTAEAEALVKGILAIAARNR